MDEPHGDDGSLSCRRAGACGTAVGLVLAMVIAGPWMGRGHVLLLDWVSGPHLGSIGSLLGADGNTLGSSVFLLLIRCLRFVVGSSAASWLPLIGWMPLVGWGVGRLTRSAGWPASAAAAALACCNPFTLDRLAIGQLGVLWGYALLPLAVLTLASEPERRLVWAARAGLVGAALTAVTPHFFAYWLVLVVVAVALLPMVWRRATGALLAVGGAIAASCYLLVVRQPSVTVDRADLSAYRTQIEPPGLGVTIVTLRGFWRQAGAASSRSSASWLLLLLVGTFVAVGVGVTWRQREALVVAAAGLVGAVMAAGDQGPLGGLYRFAFDNIGPFRILREPQKASSLVAIALSVFFGFGAARLVALIAVKPANLIAAAILITVPIGTAPAFPTLGTRADVERPSAAWKDADRLVGSGPAGVLALPWHLYMPYPNTESTVANLAPMRFRATVVSGDNVELPGIGTTSTRLRSRYLEDLYRRGSELTDFGARIEPAGLGWVLLVKAVDWEAYRWLDQQHDLVRVLDTPELALYRSTAPTELNPSSASRRGVAGWHVRSPAGRRVPIPEVAEGRWVADNGRVEITEAGAPAIISEGTTVRSRNVRSALGTFAISGAVAVVLVLVAFGRPALGLGRRRSRADGDLGEVQGSD